MTGTHPLSTGESVDTEPRASGLQDLFAVFRRRWRVLAGTFAVVLLAATLLALLLPAVYESTATVLIEQQEIPQDMVRPTITSYADQRLQTIQQRVMTRENLLRIADAYDLYPGQRQRLPTESLLEKIIDNIDLQVVSGEFIDPRRGVPMEATIAFRLSFRDRSPDKAFKVANELYTLYHGENLESRSAQVRETSSFLEEEAEKLNAQVRLLERELSEFKELHVDELPELLATNWQLLDRAESELREIGRSRQAAREQVLFLESELAQLNPYSGIVSETGARILSTADRLSALQAELAQAQARYSPEHPDLQRLLADIDSLEAEVTARNGERAIAAELERARSELSAIRERYSVDHPDVILLSSQVEALARRIQSGTGVTKEDVGEATNPAYLQMRARLESVRLEIDSLAQKERETRRRRANLERRIERTPEVERQFREMAREYTNAAGKYQEIRAKQLEAELAEALEVGRKGEKFTLIDPPRVPERPVSPNRPLIFALGLVLAVGAAFGAARLRESLDPRVYSADAVADLLGIRPEIRLPTLDTVAVTHRLRRQTVVLSVAAVLATAAALIAVNQLLIPLDAGWAVLMKRLGG